MNGLQAKTRVSPTDQPGVAANQRRFDYYEAGFDATWEIDIFGGVRRGYEASRATVDSTLASLDDSFVTVTSEVARNYFELRGLQGRYEVAKRNADVQRSSRDLTQQRLDAGRGTELDVARAQAQLSTTLATLPQLEAAIARTRYRLAVLTAHQPGTADERLEPRPMPAIPEFTPVGEPTDWLRRRPDVRVAERNLAASTALIGVAVSDLFPKVSLNGRFGWNGLDRDAIGDNTAEIYHYGPSISWAIFDLGHVRANINASRASAEGALARYEQTVLTALEDTEGALINHSTARAREAALAQAAEASGVATRLARLRYEEGVSDFLQVLDAERTQLEAEDLLAQSRSDSATSLVAVYKVTRRRLAAGSITLHASRPVNSRELPSDLLLWRLIARRCRLIGRRHFARRRAGRRCLLRLRLVRRGCRFGRRVRGFERRVELALAQAAIGVRIGSLKIRDHGRVDLRFSLRDAAVVVRIELIEHREPAPDGGVWANAAVDNNAASARVRGPFMSYLHW